MNAYGTYIRRTRKAAGLSLDRVAEKVDVSKAHLSDIERGRRLPSQELEERLRGLLPRLSLATLRTLDPRAHPEPTRVW